MIVTRPATPQDAPEMAALLNQIIAAGGTTAHQRPFDAGRMLHHYIAAPGLVSCFVAEADGALLGFQNLSWPDDPDDPFPLGWAIVATFARRGATQRGIGTALFAATRAAAVAAGVTTIDATIRADNSGGLAFYRKMGFVDYDRLVAIPLRDGTPVDRIRKRLNL